MKVPSQHYVGIAVGGTVVIIVANLLNTFYGWELSAMLIGLLAGLETGFLVGSYGESKKIYQRLGSTRLAIASGSYACKKVIPNVFTPAGYCIAICLAFLSSQLVANLGIMTFLKFGLDQNNKLGNWLSLAILLAIVSYMLFDSGLDHNSRQASLTEKYKTGGAKIIVSIIIGILAPVLVWVWISGIVILLTVLVIFAPLKVLSISIRKNITIPFGVIIGGLSGLFYGWTHLDFTMTSLAMITASFLGMFSAWLIVKAESEINAFTEFVGIFVPGYDGPK